MNLHDLIEIVAIRTLLSWSLTLELEGRWPWQRDATHGAPAAVQSESAYRAPQP